MRIRPKTGSKKADVSAAVRSGGTVVAEKKRTFSWESYRVPCEVALGAFLLSWALCYNARMSAARGDCRCFQASDGSMESCGTHGGVHALSEALFEMCLAPHGLWYVVFARGRGTDTFVHLFSASRCQCLLCAYVCWSLVPGPYVSQMAPAPTRALVTPTSPSSMPRRMCLHIRR